MLDVLKVRIYPNKDQETSLAKSFGCSRFVWNFYLNKTNTQYEETGKGMTYLKMAKDLTQLKKLTDYEWLQEPTAAVLQQSLKNLESAFKNFFGKRAGFPKFKNKHSKQSIRFPESCSIKEGGLKLPKLGIVKASLSKSINGKIKSVTVSKISTDKYFAAILFETGDLTNTKEGKISGIDLGLTSLITVFDGETCYKVDPIKPTRKYAKRLRIRQKALSRKVKGSNNRRKAVKVVAKVHEKISNTRQNFLHKLSRKLCDDNQVIVAENLCLKGLARTKLAKSIHDAGFGILLNFVSYKLERERGKFIQVDRFFPSTKLCFCCGYKNDLLNLSIREWICPSCQTTHDRDENASRNLRAEGIRILSTNTVGHTEFQACGETVRLVGTCAKKRVSEKQESPATLL
ncbi:Transposase, IS891/IS1136/IS1341 (plasmid) [Trichormus variabilis ATCC 29413]|uniref:Transposase, IS891/IS1136/IS1341 n=2 Tax=Anabaena variabilis TaxID=264691 RepID=Q3M2H4_TRIV2|nr:MULTISPECIES: RNA-guided endonuclease TnpB family protein [Nostocaceae]ABA24812.1 Transposase, IS891/IS1136/IS1341 [Trichormus variabilis ATCC 29413]MBC1218016.1 transposase [Trichormus variabilis ARAD]MBC1259217.1 transposase [Trichormus variabilis V5]MBC1270630.1 transposase [Trichormus variabilis FSR]MBC1305483.1 transposase [Trichormus variabilis N2B]